MLAIFPNLIFLVALDLLYGCGNSKTADSSNTQTPADGIYTTALESPTWEEVNAVLANSCSGSTCHSSEGTQVKYVGNQALFTSNYSSIKSQLSADLMPKGKSLSSADKQTVLNYIASIESESNTDSTYSGIYQTALTNPTWSEIDAVLVATCSGTACHSSGSSQTIYVGSETTFNTNRASVKSQLEGNTMPKTGSITSPDEQTIINYIANLNASGTTPTVCDSVPVNAGLGIATPSWNDFNTISQAKCAGGACHSGTGGQKAYVGNQTLVAANKEEIILQLTKGRMPKTGTISAADKQTMYNYLKILCDAN